MIRPALLWYQAGDGAGDPDCVSSSESVLRLFLLDATPQGLLALSAALPDVVRTPLGLEIPLRELGPEEVLALCLRFGVTARATRIMERARPG